MVGFLLVFTSLHIQSQALFGQKMDQKMHSYTSYSAFRKYLYSLKWNEMKYAI
jgi:hypothetical protein